MKKLLALLLALTMILSMAACGGEKDTATPDDKTSSETKKEDKKDDQKEDQTIAESAQQNVGTFIEAQESGYTAWKKLTPEEGRKLYDEENRYPLARDTTGNLPTTMSPFVSYAASNTTYVATQYSLYETLLLQVGVGKYESMLAENWYYEDDTHIIFELYDYIHDSDGNPFTASDVVWSYESFVASGYASDFDYYAGVEAVDEYTVRFTLTKKMESLTAFDTMFTRTLLTTEKASQDHNLNVDPVGTGPYYCKEYVSGSYILLEADENYWQTDKSKRSSLSKQNAQQVQWDFVTDATMRVVALENGTALQSELSTEDIPRFSEGGELADDFNLYTNMGVRISEILPNCSENNICNDINMRLALYYAIDSHAIAQSQGEVTNTVAVVDASIGVSDYQDEWNEIESYQTVYDPDLAKEYMEKAGYNGETLRLIYKNNAKMNKLAQLCQSLWAAVGINVELMPLDNAIYSENIKDPNGWDICIETFYDMNYACVRLLKAYSTTYGKTEGNTTSFINDPELEAALQDCCTSSGYSVEKTTDLLHHIIDNAYGYATTYVMDYSAFNKDVAKVAYTYNDGFKVWGSCDFYAD